MTNQKPLNKVQIDMLSQALYALETYGESIEYYRERYVRCRPGSGGVVSGAGWTSYWSFANPQGGVRTAKALAKKGMLAMQVDHNDHWNGAALLPRRSSENYRFTITELGKRTLEKQIGGWVVGNQGWVLRQRPVNPGAIYER